MILFIASPWRRAFAAGAGVLLLGGLAVGLYLSGVFRGKTGPGTPVDPGKAGERQAVEVPHVGFTDFTDGSGVRFVHYNGVSKHKLLPETMGSGVAVIDFDGDGKPDLLFVNGCPWPGEEPASGGLPTLKLYRNLGGRKFQDVTREAGLDVTLYGMGACVGDFDNDGHPDLFITGVGGNRLFRNVAREGGAAGRFFQDVTAKAEVAGPGGWPGGGKFVEQVRPLNWSSSATFLDYDGDGKLDLFVCNYVTWSPGLDLAQDFTLTGKGRSYGPPTAFMGANCLLYRNLGGGKFKDVSAEAGVQVFKDLGTDSVKGKVPLGKALAVTACDLDGDGWPDLVVANDTVQNFLFHNVPGPDGTRRFEERGLEAGVAYAEGKARGAMGIDWAPGFRKGCGVLAIGNFADEPDTFLCQEKPGELAFSDRALAEGIAGPSRLHLKFGVNFFDYDLDGRPDLLTCNGHLDPEINLVQGGQTYAQSVQLFWNTGRSPRGYEPVTEKAAGPDLFRPLVGRGSAIVDLDGDGAPDIVLTGNGGSARLLGNNGGTGHHWVRLRLVGDGVRSNTSALGAKVVLEAGGITQTREVTGARGYLSQGELVVAFGLGKADRVDRVSIQWPGKDAGPPLVLTEVALDRETRVVQGKK